MEVTEKTEGGTYPWKENPLGDVRYLSTGQGGKRGGKRKREMEDTGTRSGNPGARRDLGSRPRTEREESTETSGGGWRVKETYM